MGRRPKPTELKRLEGNPGRRPLNESEPQPSKITLPKAPSDMDSTAVEVWNTIGNELINCGILTLADLPIFKLFCDYVSTYEQAKEIIATEGLIAISEKGSQYQHPAVGIKNKAAEQIKILGREFGLTPSARSYLKIGQTLDNVSKSETEAFLFGGVVHKNKSKDG